MTTPSVSLSEYLTAVTENVSQAQQQISRRQIPGRFGQPATGYYMSKVDFDLKIWLDPRDMRVSPVSPYSPVPQASNIIKGSLVSVPKDINTKILFNSCIKNIDNAVENAIRIDVEVLSSDGQFLVDTEVRVMLDIDESRKLNGSSNYQFGDETQLTSALGLTDAMGMVSNINLTIDDQELSGTYIAILIEVLGESESIVYQVS